MEFLLNLELFESEYYISQLVTNPEFEKRFLETYKEPIYVRAQLAYDMVSLLGNLTTKAKEQPNTQDLVSELKKVVEYNGVSGKIHLSSNGKSFQTEVKEMMIKNGSRMQAVFDNP